LGGSILTIKKNAKDLVVASKEIGLEVNADKTKYMVKSQDQDAGRSHNINIDNGSFGRVEEFKCLETAVISKFYARRN
jgi:hypothetical protein